MLSSVVKIYHVNDISVYLGRQRGEGSPSKERAKGLIFSSAPNTGVLNVHEVKRVPLLVQNEKHVHEMRLLDQ